MDWLSAGKNPFVPPSFIDMFVKDFLLLSVYVKLSLILAAFVQRILFIRLLQFRLLRVILSYIVVFFW